jgi:uncharacterized protein YjaG (DUF416 family)
MLEFNEKNLERRLSALSARKQAAFLLLLCERMMPEFRQFASEVGLDLTVCRDCLECGWEYLAGNPSTHDYLALAEACLRIAPDTEDHDHVLTSAALDAALSLNDLMIFLSDQKIDHIVEAASLARDTVFLYLRCTQGPGLDSLSLEDENRHPLMQRELKRQEEDLVFLECLPSDVDEKLIPSLRERSKRRPEMLAPVEPCQ